MKITLETGLRFKDMPYLTIGHWFHTPEGATIQIADLPDWRYTCAVLCHELIEFIVSHAAGVTTEEADAFDQFYEDEYGAGRINPAREAGFDKRCPYGRGHRWGARMERLVIFLTGADWDTYTKACNDAMEITDEQEEEPRDEPDFYAEWWQPEVEPTFEAPRISD